MTSLSRFVYERLNEDEHALTKRYRKDLTVIAAHRRIVDEYVRQSDLSGDSALEEDRSWLWEEAVMFLARVHRDHRDYETAWGRQSGDVTS